MVIGFLVFSPNLKIRVRNTTCNNHSISRATIMQNGSHSYMWLFKSILTKQNLTFDFSVTLPHVECSVEHIGLTATVLNSADTGYLPTVESY